jgi:hypothetical protein
MKIKFIQSLIMRISCFEDNLVIVPAMLHKVLGPSSSPAFLVQHSRLFSFIPQIIHPSLLPGDMPVSLLNCISFSIAH